MIPLGILAASGFAPVSAGSFDLLETEILASSAASVTFSGLSAYAADYQHLQIRMTARDNRAATGNLLRGRINGATSGYTGHGLYGDGSTVGSFRIAETDFFHAGICTSANGTASTFRATVLDILDPFSSNKNTTTRAITGGAEGTGQNIRLYSGLYLSTTPVSSISILAEGSNLLVTGSRFSLYGIRGL